jgi:hypothetical protein
MNFGWMFLHLSLTCVVALVLHHRRVPNWFSAAKSSGSDAILLTTQPNKAFWTKWLTLKMKTVRLFGTSVNIYQSTWRNIPWNTASLAVPLWETRSPSLDTQIFVQLFKKTPRFMEPISFLPYSRYPDSGPCLETEDTSPYHHTVSSCPTIWAPHLYLNFPVVLSLQISQLNFYVLFSFFACLLHLMLFALTTLIS